MYKTLHFIYTHLYPLKPQNPNTIIKHLSVIYSAFLAHPILEILHSYIWVSFSSSQKNGGSELLDNGLLAPALSGVQRSVF
jgi:hypothetical protein